MKPPRRSLFGIFLLWFLLTSSLFLVSRSIIPQNNRFAYSEKPIVNPVSLWNRANFDGVHYLFISENSYGLYEQSFFPLYPIAIKAASLITSYRETAAIILSLFFLIVSLVVMEKLFEKDLDRKTSLLAIALFLVFPTSFFFGAVYSEALFLLLSLLSFYWARNQKWIPSSIVAALATATRPSGIFLVIALAIEWIYQKREKAKPLFEKSRGLVQFLPLLIMPLGLLLYMAYLYLTTGDPILFVHLEPLFGLQRSSEIILPYQVAYRYLRMLLTLNLHQLVYFTVILEAITSAFASLILVLGLFLKERPSYLTYIFLGVFIPSLSGTLVSEPRFIILLFPVFLILARLIKNNPLLKYLYVVISLIGLVIANLFFGAGYFVS